MRKSRIEVTKDGKLPITKIDAAVRQLETAITLWFHDGDPVSICTLSFAAYEILYSLSKSTRKRPALLDAHNIKPEFKEDFIAMIKEAPNFFKHAGKDPHATVFLTTKNQPHIFFDAVGMYHGLGVGMRPMFRVFVDWFWITEPQLFLKKPEDVFGAGYPVNEVVLQGKQAYFAMALPFYTGRIAGINTLRENNTKTAAT